MDERVTASVRRKYDRNARFFDRMDRMVQDDWRRQVTARATGNVLEVGVGTGKNLPFYQSETTVKVTGIDLSPGMLSVARGKGCPVPQDLVEMDAQRMAFPDGSFDTVVATCVFCTVPDPVAGLREVRRVCRPGGRIVLMEHVRVDKPIIGRLMDALDPLVVWLMGTHINRRTVENVRRAGLTIERIERLKGDLVLLIEAVP
ncbi:MAG: class I SAM-dependent methyltransferase [Thermaerobacter sp.]|nr:class I SAM-dependent methyltransferase [Thermaerobacter sp.]